MPRDLLKWYDANQRVLPWRRLSKPYPVWLSEVMLQQTQVSTVEPYFIRWLDRFPTVVDVAHATSDEVLKMWEGLGYYARARKFHQACQIIADQFGGTIPDDPDDFRRLPGVGPYTFAAVRSICYGDRLPAVDGNLKRVTSRLLCLKATGTALAAECEQALAKVIPGDRPGDFNQAMMDLGATVCSSASPQCPSCPVAQHCLALSNDIVGHYPVRTAARKRPHYDVAVGLIWRGDQLLIGRRPEKGLLGGLWEFPGGKVEPGETAEEAVRREILEEVGLSVTVDAHIGSIEHGYTHFAITMQAFHCSWIEGEAQNIGCTATQWIRFDEL
ncbi:MAG: A/G-specific adenine glycosylase [Candidatus Marinimicrobia bacterium]|nr:A/G-specific adenine glycosylase [Candidatus Neomarinimicrobiota bacterium]